MYESYYIVYKYLILTDCRFYNVEVDESSLKSGYKSKSSLSSSKNMAGLAAGSYVGYKLGRSVGTGPFSWGHGWGAYYGYSYGPYYYGYHPFYSPPYYYYSSYYNRYAYKTQACYQCTSIDGSDQKCENMDDDYNWDELDGFRSVCPVESECIVTIGRVWPIVKEQPPTISNQTKEEVEKIMKNFEGKNFIKRSCVPKTRLNPESCKSFPSKSNFEFDDKQAEVYQCNICDTESCNSWGVRSMPDSNYILKDKMSGWQIAGYVFLSLFFFAALIYGCRRFCRL